MINVNLEAQLAGHVFPFLLVFTRLGAALMLFPGIGEAFVTPRIRLLFALLLSFLVYQTVMPNLPQPPASIAAMTKLVVGEALVGILFSSLLRLLVGTIETTGAVISIETGLSNAMILNPTLASQSALPSAFLSIAAVTLLFLTGLDHLLLRGLLDTYRIFPVGDAMQPGDMAQTYIQMMSKSFTVGVEIAAPFLIVGFTMHVALGFMQRLLPQIQLFIIALPIQIWGGMFLFMITLSAIFTVWLAYFDRTYAEIMLR